jgi:hypothetical protein
MAQQQQQQQQQQQRAASAAAAAWLTAGVLQQSSLSVQTQRSCLRHQVLYAVDDFNTTKQCVAAISSIIQLITWAGGSQSVDQVEV